MPRPRQTGSSPLRPGQASYVLDRMVSERRISPGEINRYVSEMGREISDLEEKLARLREAHGAGGAAPARRGPGRPPGPRGPGRPPGRPAGRRRGRPPGRPAAAQTAAAPAPAKGAKRGRRRRSAITPEQLASRQLQGRYLALVRQFSANRRGMFAKTAKEKGREAAIKEMQDALKK